MSCFNRRGELGMPHFANDWGPWMLLFRLFAFASWWRRSPFSWCRICAEKKAAVRHSVGLAVVRAKLISPASLHCRFCTVESAGMQNRPFDSLLTSSMSDGTPQNYRTIHHTMPPLLRSYPPRGVALEKFSTIPYHTIPQDRLYG